MGDPLRVRVTGPLVGFVPAFREALFDSGYASNTVAQQLRLVADVSGWLGRRRMDVHDLSPSVIDSFVRCRRRTHVNLCTPRALAPFVGFLNDSCVERKQNRTAPLSVTDQILDSFRYLVSERALRAATVTNYLNQTRPFLRWRAQKSGDDFATLTADEVTAFLLLRAVDETLGSVRVAATAIRSLLKWMFLTGITPGSLAGAIGPIAYSSYAGLPKGLSTAQLRDLTGQAALSAIAAGRNMAVVAVLSRLGLRSAEVAGLLLSDINWRAGTITVAGKGGRSGVMPLPADVGASLAEYLQKERPCSRDRHVFLRVLAPHSGMSPSGISQVVTSLGTRAGIAHRIGAHRLRHTAATAVLAAGGGLVEAGQLMRHNGQSATVIYAKVDVLSLRLLARPWPGQAAAGCDATADATEPVS